MSNMPPYIFHLLLDIVYFLVYLESKYSGTMKTLVTIGVIIDPATNPLNAEEV